MDYVTYYGPGFLPFAGYFGFQPFLYEDSKMTPGFRWKDGNGNSNGYPFTNHLELKTVGVSVTTPDGHTFNNCALLERNIIYPNGYDWDPYLSGVMYHVCKGVGFVQGVRIWSDGSIDTLYVTWYNIP